MSVRLIAIDIDGTLLDSRWQLPDANRRAILEAVSRGIDVVLATGRRFDFARPVLDLIPEVRTIIVSGGAVTKTRDGDTLARRILPREVARQILDATRAFRSDMGVVFDRRGAHQLVYEQIVWDDPRYQGYFERNRDALGEAVPLEACLVEDPIQVMAASGVARIRALADVLRALPEPHAFEVALTEYPGRDLSILDVTAAGVSKGSALADLARARGVVAGSVMAIGDNLNDWTMLEFAGLQVVMGNASPELKATGWEQTASNDDAGVARAIQRHVLENRGRSEAGVAKIVAIIGASNDRRKFGNKAVRAFLKRGHTVIPINPHEDVIEGLKAYRSVLDVPGKVDMASVYLPAQAGVRVMPEIARKGIPEIWLNPGADEVAVVAAARANGLEPILACSILGIGERPGEY
jgi:Cof subfamily protein (haloacid dehalogenase superfamily)